MSENKRDPYANLRRPGAPVEEGADPRARNPNSYGGKRHHNHGVHWLPHVIPGLKMGAAPDPARLIHYMIAEPPSYDYPGHRDIVKEPKRKAHLEATTIWSRFDLDAFARKRKRIRLALACMDYIRRSGGVVTRLDLRNRMRGYAPDPWPNQAAYLRELSQALTGCRKVGWMGTLYLPDGVRPGQLPGAPCPQCRAWLTPERIEEIRALEPVGYSEATVGVFRPTAPDSSGEDDADQLAGP